MTSDYVEQLRGVQDVQQRSQNAALRDAGGRDAEMQLSQVWCGLLANVNVQVRYDVARPAVRLLSVTFARPTQAIEIFDNVSMRYLVP